MRFLSLLVIISLALQEFGQVFGTQVVEKKIQSRDRGTTCVKLTQSINNLVCGQDVKIESRGRDTDNQWLNPYKMLSGVLEKRKPKKPAAKKAAKSVVIRKNPATKSPKNALPKKVTPKKHAKPNTSRKANNFG
ncbi:unnamed protein product [Clonostachys rosea]|uniref:Secreted protein n=1 Tax=Bionectria ochroleuca TaxID=29856 RepID=A0ABY6TNI3_BIOOC|nr:unnamed protein product [Clonostachys rosea]